jgi:hypothetical protein
MPEKDPTVTSPEGSEGPPTAIRKVERIQKFESNSYSVDSLERVVNSRKHSSRRAKYWELLSVKRKTVIENEGESTISFERVILECTECGKQHGGKSLAPANFASTHFDQHTTPHCRCKKAKTNGTNIPTTL